MEDSLHQFATRVMLAEADAVRQAASAIDDQFELAVRMILDCSGNVVLSGIGKAGIIARKLAATFASTGAPSHFLNPADALHGDLGAVRNGDVVLMLSYSGESDEILRLLSVIRKLGHPLISITRSPRNSLARHSNITLALGDIDEACPLGLAPTATTTAMLALGDALALSVMKLRNFTAQDFAIFHPAGQLGRKLMRVCEAMGFRRNENLAISPEHLPVKQVLVDASNIKRRCGAVLLVDHNDKLSGIFTDSDLRRLMTTQDLSFLSRPIREVMTANPKRIGGESLASEAMAVLRQYRIDELPVVDDAAHPIGIIDVQDLVVLKLFDVAPET